MQLIQNIQSRIYEIRGERVMLDRDLATLYETETKRLNQAVKRNINRFPPDFMFQLTKAEFEPLRSQIVTLETGDSSRSQFATLKTGRGKNNKYLPFAFTEHGITMLSAILNTGIAIQMNIAIIRAFIEMRRYAIVHTDWKAQIDKLRDCVASHDAQLNQIYDALENLLDERAEHKKWDDRERIGFKQ
ncbi:ORF6N domain-containing protein [Flavihumibacter solisilvae]|uniref:DNA-binding protein n=1 Tax=Flavihumibacter solisilvae TaxID=1349421 RepID=A0A0C1LKT7_9BACT|nr:ORF6N domain-containing protein [Flavihumibacter solisilvae]KIC95973.1 DNA-binding protein [Flavihumibacter solisilvae]